MADRTTFKRLRGNLHRNSATGMIIRKALAGWQVWVPTRDGMENVVTDHYFAVARRLAKEIAARMLREIDTAHAEALAEQASTAVEGEILDRETPREIAMRVVATVEAREEAPAAPAVGQVSVEAKTLRLTGRERRYLIEWLRTQMTDEADSLLLKLDD